MRRPLGTIMEQNGDSKSDEEGELAVPDIITSVSSYQPFAGSFIGDFSQNSYVFDGAEITRMKKAGEDEVGLGEEGPGDASYILPEKDAAELNSEKIQAVNADMYMGNTLDLFMRLNSKMDVLLREKNDEKRAMEECYRRILYNDIIGAISYLRPHVNTDKEEGLFRVFVERDWPAYSRRIKSETDAVKSLAVQMKNVFGRLLDRLDRKENECDRLSDMKKRQSIEHSIQVNSLISENDALKDGLITQLKRYGPPEALNSMLAVDLLNGVGSVLGKQTDELVKYRKSLLENDLELEEFKRRESSLDVTNLNKQLEEFRKAEKRLQNENLNFSETIQRVSIKNSKYKQDLVLFNSELKKSFETIKLKNETIERQRKLISLFQDKLSGCTDYPIEELKARRREIENKITREEDYLKRQILERERIDCDRRLSDFLKLKSRAPN